MDLEEIGCEGADWINLDFILITNFCALIIIYS